jgi:uncharacterized protein (DUF1697 family)
MTVFVAFLRGINLAGKKPVPMADLRRMADGLGLENTRTLLQSGNLLFDAAAQEGAQLEQHLEEAAKEVLGLKTDFMVRDAGELQQAVDSNPFPEAAHDVPGHLVLSLLKAIPAPGSLERLRSAIVGREIVDLRGRELYIIYPDGIGRSKLTSALMDRQLGTRGTGRNWNTILKLSKLLDDQA